MLAFRLARRELRGGVRGLWIVLLCLALGVSVIAAVGTLRAATDQGLAVIIGLLLGLVVMWFGTWRRNRN